jgi:LCP family protein required for cell wall assembly
MIQDAIRTFQLKVDGQQPVSIQLGDAPFGLGRDKSNGLVLPDGKVSRQHAELLLRNGVAVLRDRDSSNGTTVNGERIQSGAERVLRDGDVLGIGPYRLVFQVAAPPQPVPASSNTVTPPGNVASNEPSPGFRQLGRGITRVALGVIATAIVVGLIVAGLLWLLSPPSVSLLILGTDARPSELAAGDRGRTDTLVAYVADRDAGRNLMISIPRDLWVQTSGTTAGKINTAYRLGGASAARQAVTSSLGIPIDRHLVIGLQGVRDVVDALGGIDVDVESAIRDDHYPTDDFGITVFEISAGRHHLDGETALRYARTRYADDDLARIGRQQKVLTGIRNAASNPLNVWRLPGTLLALQRTTETDIGIRELATVAAAYVRSPGAPERFTPDWNMVQPFMSPQGEDALRPQPAYRDALAALLIGPNTSIEVLNASGRDGTARRTADTLTARGFRVSGVGTAERPQAGSMVQVRPGNRLAGQSLASLLGLGMDTVRDTGDLPSNVTIRITLGSGYAGT